MADWPTVTAPMWPIFTPFHTWEGGSASRGVSGTTVSTSASVAWTATSKAYFYEFQATDFCTAYNLLFFVGSVSSGNIDMAIYDAEKNRIVSIGSTAMSASTGTVQVLNITDTTLGPGRYLLAAACDNGTGTAMKMAATVDETSQSGFPIWEQAGLTGPTLPDPCAPVQCTDVSISFPVIGIDFRNVF